MQSRVRLLSLPSPDWHTFVSFFKEVVGRSPTRDCDARNEKVGSPSSFYNTLKDCLGPEAEQHYNISFILEISEEILISLLLKFSKQLTFAPLAVNKKETVFICFVTGSLSDIKTVIVTGSKDTELRYLVNQMYVLLDKAGLIQASRKELGDGTFIVE